MRNLTFEQIKSDIASGKSTRIYYSSGTLWWTHLDSDVDRATKRGKVATKKKHREFLSNPNVPETEKKRLRALNEAMKMSRESTPDRPPIPTDPFGAPLHQMDDPGKWVSVAERNPKHFGKHGVEAFLLAHHQNCTVGFKNWDGYNSLIDNEKH